MSEGFLKFYKLIIKPDSRSVRSLSQILGAVDIFTFPPLNVNWTFRGEEGVRQWTLVRGIFGRKQTHTFL